MMATTVIMEAITGKGTITKTTIEAVEGLEAGAEAEIEGVRAQGENSKGSDSVQCGISACRMSKI